MARLSFGGFARLLRCWLLIGCWLAVWLGCLLVLAGFGFAVVALFVYACLNDPDDSVCPAISTVPFRWHRLEAHVQPLGCAGGSRQKGRCCCCRRCWCCCCCCLLLLVYALCDVWCVKLLRCCRCCGQGRARGHCCCRCCDKCYCVGRCRPCCCCLLCML